MKDPRIDDNTSLENTISNVVADVNNKKEQKEFDPDFDLLKKQKEVKSFLREAKVEGMDYWVTVITHKFVFIVLGIIYLLVWYVSRLWSCSCNAPKWVCTLYQDLHKLMPYIISNVIVFVITKIFTKQKNIEDN